MKKTSPDVYWCFYCERSNVPLIQLGKETHWSKELDRFTVSPEDSNAVEICEDCLRKALKLFTHE
jgi:hypothetical protein